MTFVYGLIDPLTKKIAYVGLSVNPETRLRAHINEGRRLREKYGQLGAWIAALDDQGLEPQLVILDQGDDAAMVQRETELIQSCRLVDSSLLNVCDGAVGRRGRGDAGYAGAPPARGKLKPFGLRIDQKTRKPVTRESAVTPDELRAFRDRHGWTQAELAHQLGVHYSAVSLWESGKRRVPQSVAMSLRLLDNVKV